MTDPIRAALERLIARLDETTDPSGPVPAWSDSFYAARAALAQPAPPAEGDVTDAELNAMWNCSGIADEYGNHTGNIFEFARAAIALDRTRRAPVLKEKGICPACEGSPTAANNPCAVCGCSAAPPAEGEVEELVELLRFEANTDDAIDHTHWLTADQMHRAADLLEQRHPVPVPVSERMPGPRDCAPWPGETDASAWCWVGSDVDGGWAWEQRSAGCLAAFPGDFTHWLPAHALPLPAGEGVQP